MFILMYRSRRDYYGKKRIPDLVICYIMMSGVYGYSLLEELRRNGAAISTLQG